MSETPSKPQNEIKAVKRTGKAMKQHALTLKDQDDRWTLPPTLLSIVDEHKYVSRLLVLMDEETENLAETGKADIECIEDILNYICHYPDRYHHPKEELIFDRMEPKAEPKTLRVIKRLREAHHQVSDMGSELLETARNLKKRGTKRQKAQFAKKLEHYSDGLRDHMYIEESQIFEPAIRLLKAEDWKAIDRKMKPIIDPIFGDKKADEYVHLFGRYLNRVVSVSTGNIPSGMIESIFAAAERLIYTTGELKQLPSRLLEHSKSSTITQLKTLSELRSVRDLDSARSVLREASESCLAGSKTSLEMIKNALLAIEHHEEEDIDDNSMDGAITLTEDQDFLTFHEKPLSRTSAKISWQATLTNLLFRTTVKQLMAHLGTGPAAQLKKMKSLTDNVPPNVTAKDVEFNSFRARWIKPKGQAATKKTILMLPGGGFFFPASSWHTSMLASVCRKAKCQGLLVHYRLAPDHPFPAGLEDAVNAYKYLLEQGIAPEDIVLMGDSAGGGLSLSLLLAIRDEGLPMPKAATLISPLADLSFSTPSRDFNRWRDPMLPTRRKMEAFQLYTGDTPSDDPLLSPIYGDLSGLPPLYAHVSSTEILLDDTLRVARKARAAGVEVEVEVWEGLPHVWHLCAFMPESDKALTHIARFFKRQFKQAPALTLV